MPTDEQVSEERLIRSKYLKRRRLTAKEALRAQFIASNISRGATTIVNASYDLTGVPELAGYVGAVRMFGQLALRLYNEIQDAIDRGDGGGPSTAPEWVKDVTISGPDPFPMDTGFLPRKTP